MNTNDIVQAAARLALEDEAIEARYSAVKQAYDDLDMVTPETLETYNRYLQSYHIQSKKQHVFTMEMITTLQTRMAEVERSLAETKRVQARTDRKQAEIDRNTSAIRAIWAVNEAEAILLRADPDAWCPTCGYGYGTGEEEDITP